MANHITPTSGPTVSPHSISELPARFRFLLQCGLLFSFGLIYFLIIPPFQVPDEFHHFYRIVQITGGGIMPEKTMMDGRLAVGGTLPKSVLKISEPFRGTRALKVTLQGLENASQVAGRFSLRDPDRSFVSFPALALYSPVPYLAQSLGVRLGDSLGLNVLEVFYLGRFFGFLYSGSNFALSRFLLRN